MPRQAPSAVTGRLVGKVKAQGQEEGAHELEERLAIAPQLQVGRFMLKIHSDSPVFAWVLRSASHGAPPGQQVSSDDETRWG